jgi:hypothetical protein
MGPWHADMRYCDARGAMRSMVGLYGTSSTVFGGQMGCWHHFSDDGIPLPLRSPRHSGGCPRYSM